MESPRVLIADDQPHVIEALRLLLKSEGCVPEAVTSPAEVMRAIGDRRFDALLLDMNYTRDTTSGNEGLDLVAHIHEIDNSLPVVLMTAWGSIELAVQGMQNGGCDFIQKPWDNAKLLNSLWKHVEEGRALRQKKQELEQASDIQRKLLPLKSPEVLGYDVQVFWKPLAEVGGDYFDVIPRDDSTAAFCIADVAGKGFPAALLMSHMQASVRGLAPCTTSPAEICRELNRLLRTNTQSERLTTFFYAIVDPIRGVLRYANAGHIPPFLLRKNGEIRRLSEGGLVLGVRPYQIYDEAETAFREGDRLIMLTDGITEALNAQDEEFGADRIIDILHRDRNLSPLDLHKALLQSLYSFALEGLQDDATIVTVSRCGAIQTAIMSDAFDAQEPRKGARFASSFTGSAACP